MYAAACQLLQQAYASTECNAIAVDAKESAYTSAVTGCYAVVFLFQQAGAGKLD